MLNFMQLCCIFAHCSTNLVGVYLILEIEEIALLLLLKLADFLKPLKQLIKKLSSVGN